MDCELNETHSQAARKHEKITNTFWVSKLFGKVGELEDRDEDTNGMVGNSLLRLLRTPAFQVRQDVVTVLGSMPTRRAELLDESAVLLYDQRPTRLVAKYIYDVLEVFNTTTSQKRDDHGKGLLRNKYGTRLVE